MKTFKNASLTKRNYECSNIVACQGSAAPAKGQWIECDASEIIGLTPLWIENGVKFYGHL